MKVVFMGEGLMDVCALMVELQWYKLAQRDKPADS